MANPSDKELAELCACIHSSLSPTDRELSRTIVAGEEAKLDPEDLQAFIPRFGDALRQCSGNRF